MRRPIILLAILGVSCPVLANICAFDQAPAASLLFPLVTLDYETPYGGETTLIAVTNLSHESQVVQVGFWTDLGVPFLEFNMVLAGYDVQRFNVRDILYHGTLPVTVSQDHPGAGHELRVLLYAAPPGRMVEEARVRIAHGKKVLALSGDDFGKTFVLCGTVKRKNTTKR